jgi:hypothetical protein
MAKSAISGARAGHKNVAKARPPACASRFLQDAVFTG